MKNFRFQDLHSSVFCPLCIARYHVEGYKNTNILKKPDAFFQRTSKNSVSTLYIRSFSYPFRCLYNLGQKNSVLAPTFFFTLSQGLLITTYLGIKNLVCSLKTNYQQALYVKRNLEAC